MGKQEDGMMDFKGWRSLNRRFSASITVEAAICLPVFLFAALILLAPIRMLDERRKLQNVMEAAAKDLALAAYAENMLEEKGGALLNRRQLSGSSAGKAEGAISETLLNGINTGAAAARILTSMNGSVFQSPYFTRCEVLQDDMIALELHYEMRFPFRIFGKDGIQMSSVVNRRAWTGAEGGRGSGRYASGKGADEDGYSRDADGERVVYVGQTSTVYHKQRSCHYLANVLKPVDAETIDRRRNASGGKYHACESCKPGKHGQVYIMESGTAYHGSESCRAIGAYAREVRLEEVEHLGPCSYCSGGKRHVA